MCQNWIRAVMTERKVVRVDFVASQWVGSLNTEQQWSGWWRQKVSMVLWERTGLPHAVGLFQFCDRLLPMTPCILRLTFLSLSFLIFKNRNNKTCCPSLIINQCEHSGGTPVANKSRFINPSPRGKAPTREPWHVSPTEGKTGVLQGYGEG